MPAFVAALSVFSILTIFSYISVVHMNPTVTFALFFSGVFDARLILPYIMAQLLGAPEGSAYRDFWLVFSIFVCFILCNIILIAFITTTILHANFTAHLWVLRKETKMSSLCCQRKTPFPHFSCNNRILVF